MSRYNPPVNSPCLITSFHALSTGVQWVTVASSSEMRAWSTFCCGKDGVRCQGTIPQYEINAVPVNSTCLICCREGGDCGQGRGCYWSMGRYVRVGSLLMILCPLALGPVFGTAPSASSRSSASSGPLASPHLPRRHHRISLVGITSPTRHHLIHPASSGLSASTKSTSIRASEKPRRRQKALAGSAGWFECGPWRLFCVRTSRLHPFQIPRTGNRLHDTGQ